MNGSCQCSAITFQTPTPTPKALWHCHCTDCRKQSGSAYGTSAIFPFFKLPESEHLSHFIHTNDSGRQKYCYFCNKCGTRLMHVRIVEDGDPPGVAVKAGVLDGEGLDWRNAKHIYCRSKVVEVPEGVERFEEGPGV